MRHALRIAAFSCSLAALTAISGGHWAVLQTVAWARMLIDYTHDSGSLRQGVADTFDGAHPCKWCRQISAGKAMETRDERQRTVRDNLSRKITLAMAPASDFSAPVVRPDASPSTRVTSADGRMAEAPPVPPPRPA